MNETITIKEGGLTRRLAPIDKLKVNTTDNKDSTWVSAGKANTGVLHASENGIYIASEDGYEAYSEVIVRVTKDSFEGDTSFDDWEYETPDMDLDNWDPETIEDFELDPDGFDDIFNNENEWKDIDKPIDIKMNNPKIKDTKISGIDPVTGNEMEVGLDADGYLTESTLPSSIKIEVPPDKLQYIDGQPIIFRGMIVKAYIADGELWTNENHPNGVLLDYELTFPISYATIPSDWKNSKTYTDETGSFPFSTNAITYTGIDVAPERPGTISVDNYKAIVGIQENGDGTYLKYVKASDEKIEGSTTYIKNNRTVYYTSGRWLNGVYGVNPVTNISASIEDIAWAMIYGDITESGTQTIPVQYIRSDGEVLEDSFTIEVLPDPDGAHPQVDPSTVEWNHRRYKANEDLGAVEVRHGSVYMEGGAIYDVGAAVKLGMLEPVDNEIVP